MDTSWRSRLATAWGRTAKPSTQADADALERYEPIGRPLVAVAAILPFAFPLSTTRPWVSGLIAVGTWSMFVVDLVVQARHRDRYFASRLGVMDLAIVILTSPWYLIPGLNGASLVVLLRAARLARLVLVLRGARVLIERLGRAALIAAAVLVVFSWVAYDAESPVNPEFGSYGDSLWWGIVTMTTVGYGDIVPETSAGRYAAIIIMVMGVALLGVLAGSLASFFRISPEERREEDDQSRNQPDQADVQVADAEPSAVHTAAIDDQPDDAAGSRPSTDPDLVREVAELRRQITALAERLDHAPPEVNRDSGAP